MAVSTVEWELHHWFAVHRAAVLGDKGALHSLCHNSSTLLLQRESSYRQYINKWACCAPGTLYFWQTLWNLSFINFYIICHKTLLFWFVSVTLKWKNILKGSTKTGTSHWFTPMDLDPSARLRHHHTLTLSIWGRWTERRVPLGPWGSRHNDNIEWRKEGD